MAEASPDDRRLAQGVRRNEQMLSLSRAALLPPGAARTDRRSASGGTHDAAICPISTGAGNAGP